MNFIGTELYGKTLGIIGFGRIGRHLAKISHLGFNMEILYTDVSLETIEIERVKATKVSKEELLEKSDVVALCCNLCEETRHMIDTKEFSLMKPTAYLINTSRGGIVNEKDIIKSLKNDLLSGYATDALEGELNYSIKSELMKNINNYNIIITPHIGGMTKEARELAYNGVLDLYLKKTNE